MDTVGRDWPVDGLEFLNSAGTDRFRLSQLTEGSPVLLLRASANEESATFKDTGISGKAIPVLSLLALRAETSADGVDKRWIHQVVWWNKGRDWRVNETGSSDQTNVIKVVKTLRDEIGQDTIETVPGGYRLTVQVQRAAPAPITPATTRTTSASVILSERRAEDHARLISSQVFGPGAIRLPQNSAWFAVLAVVAIGVAWFVVRYRSAGLPVALYYGVAVSGALLAMLAGRQLIRTHHTTGLRSVSPDLAATNRDAMFKSWS